MTIFSDFCTEQPVPAPECTILHGWEHRKISSESQQERVKNTCRENFNPALICLFFFDECVAPTSKPGPNPCCCTATFMSCGSNSSVFCLRRDINVAVRVVPRLYCAIHVARYEIFFVIQHASVGMAGARHKCRGTRGQCDDFSTHTIRRRATPGKPG